MLQRGVWVKHADDSVSSARVSRIMVKQHGAAALWRMCGRLVSQIARNHIRLAYQIVIQQCHHVHDLSVDYIFVLCRVLVCLFVSRPFFGRVWSRGPVLLWAASLAFSPMRRQAENDKALLTVVLALRRVCAGFRSLPHIRKSMEQSANPRSRHPKQINRTIIRSQF